MISYQLPPSPSSRKFSLIFYCYVKEKQKTSTYMNIFYPKLNHSIRKVYAISNTIPFYFSAIAITTLKYPQAVWILDGSTLVTGVPTISSVFSANSLCTSSTIRFCIFTTISKPLNLQPLKISPNVVTN